MTRLIATMVLSVTATICYGQALAPSAQVIANEIGMEEITLSMLRGALRGELSQWPSHQPVAVVFHSTAMEECSLTASFVLDSHRPAALQKFWMGLVFGGRAAPPIFVKSQKELIETVRYTPGSVGLVYGIIPPQDLTIIIKEE